jgi:uncharacterized protein GlcG (DUF336 family)
MKNKTIKIKKFKPSISLSQSNKIINKIFFLRKKYKLYPLTVAILDNGGNLVSIQKEDGSSLLRPNIAIGKAFAALSMGTNSGNLKNLLGNRQEFLSAISFQGSKVSSGLIPAPGGVLIIKDGKIIGSVGVSGDTSENDLKVIEKSLKLLKYNKTKKR